MNNGFVKVAAAVPALRVAEPKYNVEQIERSEERRVGKECRL